MHDFEWWLERLDVHHWESESPGARSFFANCPVHGGGDAFHVTEKNGKAAVHCFGCDGKYRDFVDALEDELPSVTESEPTIPTVTRKRRTHERVTEGVEQVTDPIDWYAQYCGVSRSVIEDLGVVATSDGWVRHTWESTTVAKDRRPNTGDRRWTPKGATQPRMWPTVPDTLPSEIWLAEGESDVIVLRGALKLEAYTAGSASQPLSAEEMKGLKDRGVERIVVAYDNDKAGRQAAKETVEAARECGILAVNAILGDPLLGGPKDWRERHLSGDDSVPTTDADEAAANVWMLKDVDPAESHDLLLDRVHPTDHTILFGDGGTGKGVVAAWWVARLTQQGKRVLVLDYEAHATHEWRPRVERFGGALDQVFIMQPSQAIWDVTGAVVDVIARHTIDLIVVDSVTYACLGVEVEKSATAAQYSVALAQFHRPVLSLAHVTKTDLNPGHPFGSIFWSNGARVTISIHRKEENDHASPRILQNRKTNQAAPFKSVEIPWDWVDSDLPETLTERDAQADPAMLKMAIMQVVGYETIGVAKIVQALKETGIDTNYKQVSTVRKEIIETLGTLSGLPKRVKRSIEDAE